MIRYTEEQARELLGDKYPGPKKKPNKFGARKTVIDGIKFDSQAEANYYCVLLLRQKAGEITKFDLQPVFVLQEAYTDSQGRKHRALTYRADFRVYYPDGREEIVDVKGHRTREYINKIKILLSQNPGMWFTEAT